MKNELINRIKTNMKNHLNEIQMKKLSKTLEIILNDFEVFKKHKPLSVEESEENQDLLIAFLSAKQIEGCSQNTIKYYSNTIMKMLDSLKFKNRKHHNR